MSAPAFPRRLALLLGATLVALAALVAAGVSLLMQSSGPGTTSTTSTASGAPGERCRDCHTRPEEDPGGAHAAAVIGCEPCHLGNPLATTADAAHRGMESEPGALRTVARTCGRCHAARPSGCAAR